jgi:hypothetical protein
MKKIINGLLLCMAIHFMSCSELLDKKPLDLISDANVWNDEVTASAFLVPPYREMVFLFNEFPMDQMYGPLMFGHADMSAVSDEGTTWWQDRGVAQASMGIIDETGSPFQDIWVSVYKIIRTFNICIENMQTSPIGSDAKNEIISRARWGRAMCYFALVKRYGAVPLITKPQWISDPYDELYPHRTSEQAIYDFIINECSDIFNDLPDRAASGLPCKWAAMAMKSRAAVFAASIAQWGEVQLNGALGIPSSAAANYWQICYNASDSLIRLGGYSLYDKYPNDKVKNFQELFIDEGNSECVFYYPFAGSGYSGLVSGYDMFMGPYSKVAWGGGLTTVYLEMANEFENIDGTSGALDEVKFTEPGTSWTINEIWGKKDPRFLGSVYTQETPWQGSVVDMHIGVRLPDGSLFEGTDVFYNGIIATGPDAKDSRGMTGFCVRKYVNEQRIRPDNYQSNQDWPVFRLAEIKLNKAEACIELNKTSEALMEINDIRNRAGIAPLTAINRDLVRHERKVELAFEGFRWFDLRRWRIAEQELDVRVKPFHGLRYILDYNSMQTGEARKFEVSLVPGGYGDYKVFPEKLYYLPIGLGRITNNPNLAPENPGY